MNAIFSELQDYLFEIKRDNYRRDFAYNGRCRNVCKAKDIQTKSSQ